MVVSSDACAGEKLTWRYKYHHYHSIKYYVSCSWESYKIKIILKSRKSWFSHFAF